MKIKTLLATLFDFSKAFNKSKHDIVLKKFIQLHVTDIFLPAPKLPNRQNSKGKGHQQTFRQDAHCVGRTSRFNSGTTLFLEIHITSTD